MKIISYDISNDLTRSRFAKMLKKNGAIRIQYSVYEVVNTNRVISILMAKIESYAKHFTADDSIVIFDVDKKDMKKYGNAIHRDEPIVYF